MIRHIFFDLDGTLVDSLATFVKIGNELAIRYGYTPLDDNKVRELLKLPMKKRIKQLGVPLYKLPKISLEILSRFHSHASQLQPIEGIRELLLGLKEAGYTLTIISSNSVPNIKAFLKANQLEVFEGIYSCNNLFGKHKTIKWILSKKNINKQEVIYVGDEQRDIEACKRVGVKVIAVTWGFDSLELLKEVGPDCIANKPTDIEKLLADLSN